MVADTWNRGRTEMTAQELHSEYCRLAGVDLRMRFDSERLWLELIHDYAGDSDRLMADVNRGLSKWSFALHSQPLFTGIFLIRIHDRDSSGKPHVTRASLKVFLRSRSQ